jgi:hypothetical protein
MHVTYIILLPVLQDSEQKTPEVVQVISQDFCWLEQLQTSLRNNRFSGRRVVLVTEGDRNCGLLGLVTCLMHEPGCDNVR